MRFLLCNTHKPICDYCPNTMTFAKAPPRYRRLGPQRQQLLLKSPDLGESSSREAVFRVGRGFWGVKRPLGLSSLSARDRSTGSQSGWSDGP